MNLFSSKENQEAEISRQAIEACEVIISEMGAEIHDELIQRLSVFRLSFDKLERNLSDRAQAEVQLVKMKGEFQEVIQAIRRVSRRLMPARSDEYSFEQSISLLCQNMERPGSGNIHFDVKGMEQQLNLLTEIHLSRIIQELIHNSYMHSSAWHIWVRLHWQENLFTLEVEDDGTGFSKIPEFIQRLKSKNNTLKMRCRVIGASIHYTQGQNGLIARVDYKIPKETSSD